MYSTPNVPPRQPTQTQANPPAAPSAETLVNERIFIGSNSVAQWFVTLGHHEGKPVLIAHQVFVDAPKHMGDVARTLAAGRLFFSLKQVETMMSLRHNFEVAVSDGERLRIERHLKGL
jgi:hypothetical protein